MTYSGEVASILSTFAKIIGVIFLMHILWLILQFCAVAPMSPGNRNPIRLLGTMLPAYFTALGTQSSAATIPVTLRQAEKLGVDPAVAGFTVPLCATIHMSGSTLKIVSCAVALMITRGMPFKLRNVCRLHLHARRHHHRRPGNTRRLYNGLTPDSSRQCSVLPMPTAH